MLFNSYAFLFLFLPLTLLGLFLVARWGKDMAIGWLVLASLFFYGWWNPVYLILILMSMVGNFILGEWLSEAFEHQNGRRRTLLLTIGVSANLAVLGYFKYAGFFVTNINTLTGADFVVPNVVLPLAISFFTFQQIAYLVDASRGIAEEYRFSHYALFVTFFPQLIAGPIVHHGEMLPQFMKQETFRPRLANISIGVSIVILGLFKKAVLADGVAVYGTPVFERAAAGGSLTFFEAWGGALAYTMQLYFDFSGYSDMAIGAARMFGVRLPLNFHSPYKATSIVEFWRRWHITLSRFLRDYVYIPLGGNRKGPFRRYGNLFATMLLGGLWHGAGWTFVVWGALHGFYLAVNHAWTILSDRYWPRGFLPFRLGKFMAWFITFLSVVVGWVFFRAANFDAAMAMLEGMVGFNGIAIPNAIAARLGGAWEVLAGLGVVTYLGGGASLVFTYLWIAALLVVALVMPNTQQIMRQFEPALSMYNGAPENEIRPFITKVSRIQWRPSVTYASMAALLAAVGVLALTNISEFLYFQF